MSHFLYVCWVQKSNFSYMSDKKRDCVCCLLASWRHHNDVISSCRIFTFITGGHERWSPEMKRQEIKLKRRQWKAGQHIRSQWSAAEDVGWSVVANQSRLSCNHDWSITSTSKIRLPMLSAEYRLSTHTSMDTLFWRAMLTLYFRTYVPHRFGLGAASQQEPPCHPQWFYILWITCFKNQNNKDSSWPKTFRIQRTVNISMLILKTAREQNYTHQGN